MLHGRRRNMFGTNECARCFIVQVTDSTQVTILFSPSIFNLSHNTFFTQIYSIQFKSQYFYPIQVKILFSPKSYIHINSSHDIFTQVYAMQFNSSCHKNFLNENPEPKDEEVNSHQRCRPGHLHFVLPFRV